MPLNHTKSTRGESCPVTLLVHQQRGCGWRNLQVSVCPTAQTTRRTFVDYERSAVRPPGLVPTTGDRQELSPFRIVRPSI